MPGFWTMSLSRRATAGLLGAALAGAATLAGPGTAAQAESRTAASRTIEDAGAPGTITTVAGGVGGPGPATSVSVAPCGTADEARQCGMTFAGGRLYLTDIGEDAVFPTRAGDVIRAISLRTGELTTPAGSGIPAPDSSGVGDGGPAAGAEFLNPSDIAVDAAGNQIVSDSWDDLVRVVAASTGRFYGVSMTRGDIYAVAGDSAGDGPPPTPGAPALQVAIFPVSVAADHARDLFISTADNGLWTVPAASGVFFGAHMTAGDIYPLDPAVGGFGAVRVDGHGNLVATNVDKVMVIAARAGTYYGQKMTAGHAYTVAGGGTHGLGDGGPATRALIRGADALAIDRAGDLIVADAGDGRIRLVAERTGRMYGQQMTTGHIYTVAGRGPSERDGAPARRANLKIPRAVAVDSAGNIAVASAFGRRVWLVAASTGRFYGRKMIAGHIYEIAGNGNVWLSGDGGPASRAQLHPTAETVDHAGNLVIADSGGGAGQSELRVAATRTGTFYGQKMTAGDIYGVAGNGRKGFAGDGGLATKAPIELMDTDGGTGAGVVVDHAGNLVLADVGSRRVRVVAAATGTFYGQKMTAGHIYTIAGNGGFAGGGDGGPAVKAQIPMDQGAELAIDAHGNIAIADVLPGTVRLVAATTGTFYGQQMTAGDIYLVASGLGLPGGVAVDAHGNLLIADTLASLVRVVAATDGTFYGQAMTAGHLYTVAALAATGISVDSSGNLLVTSNTHVDVVAEATGTFYGVPMTAGGTYRVAGTGVSGFSGDGGPAASAEVDNPQAAVAAGASLLISDSGNLRIRLVRG
jgi:hypothetical protein